MLLFIFSLTHISDASSFTRPCSFRLRCFVSRCQGERWMVRTFLYQCHLSITYQRVPSIGFHPGDGRYVGRGHHRLLRVYTPPVPSELRLWSKVRPFHLLDSYKPLTFSCPGTAKHLKYLRSSSSQRRIALYQLYHPPRPRSSRQRYIMFRRLNHRFSGDHSRNRYS